MQQQPQETSPQHPGVVRLHINAFYFSTTARRVTSITWGPPPQCKQALNGILRLLNFRLQNSSNFKAVIQIFLCLPDFSFICQVSPHSRSKTICIWMRWSLFTRVFSRLHLITDLWSFLPRNYKGQKAFYGPQVFRLIEIKDIWQWPSQVFFFLSEKYGIFVR